MNILEIYQNNPNTVFISRDGSRYKVKKVDADDDDYPFLMEKIAENGLGAKNWVANDGKIDKYCPIEAPDDIVDYKRHLNILEIYQNNPDTVFIARDGTRCKVEIHDATASAFQFKMLPLDGGDSFWVDGNSKRTSIFDCDNNKDIVDYERPIFTVGEYVTRDGRKAVVYYDLSEPFGMYYPLYGYIDGNEDYDTWTKQGHNDYDEDRPEDLTGPWIEKPYIITVNGKEFHPVKNPKDGERLFYVNLLSSYVANSAAWGKQRSTYTALSNLNLIYRTEEEAQAFLEEISKPHTEIKHVD
ncbi:hypothetical protein RFF38_02525 [Pasteurella multocida]|uniref:hypothetical protein n=1 Tax=Pasteurella multocida TaxID=747 RepID=UPI002B45C51F|nr:hypothetical protein [Pasteurella multocida]WRK07724.1 hypothetical protein RFF38_02525 [Pasteurella multocida]